jgi:hypothetical protein
MSSIINQRNQIPELQMLVHQINLPSDITNLIYKDHLSVYKRYKNIIEVFKKRYDLDPTLLLPLVKEVLDEDKELLTYMLSLDNDDVKYFKVAYDEVIVRRRRVFIRINDKNQQFATVWMMYAYH